MLYVKYVIICLIIFQNIRTYNYIMSLCLGVMIPKYDNVLILKILGQKSSINAI